MAGDRLYKTVSVASRTLRCRYCRPCPDYLLHQSRYRPFSQSASSLESAHEETIAVPFWKVERKNSKLADDADSTKALVTSIEVEDDDQHEWVNTQSDLELEAARALPFFLRNDRTWRAKTFEYVEVPDKTLDLVGWTREKLGRSSIDDASAERRQKRLDSYTHRNNIWFYDLLDPFQQRIQFDEGFSASLKSALKELVDLGFHNEKFRREFFKMYFHVPNSDLDEGEKLKYKIRDVEENINLLQKNLIDYQQLHQNLQKELEDVSMERVARFMDKRKERERKAASENESKTETNVKKGSTKSQDEWTSDLTFGGMFNLLKSRIFWPAESKKVSDMSDASGAQSPSSERGTEKSAVESVSIDEMEESIGMTHRSTRMAKISNRRLNEKERSLKSRIQGLDDKIGFLFKRLEEQKKKRRTLRRKAQRQTVAEKRKRTFLSPDKFESIKKKVQGEGIRDVICRALAEYIATVHARLLKHYQILDEQSNLKEPQDWFPSARQIAPRRIIFHGGPTNSGKTHQALERLKQAHRGMYFGPLRLLAAEIQERLTAEGVRCNLTTGQERKYVKGATHGAATIEMANLMLTSQSERPCDVAVIDEIQMINDDERGAAWTRALLGLDCPEIHVCGGMEARNLVQKLVESCGDSFEVREYQRFSPLEVESSSLIPTTPSVMDDGYRFSYANSVQPGDCIVAFTRKDLFAIKREIEQMTNFKCALIYGTLPPETRAEQAKLFNDSNSDYDIMVGSDALGMGLNLNIRRVIFNSIYKFSSGDLVKLTPSEVKQIGGRAGRRNSPYPNGLVTCRHGNDLQYISDSIYGTIGDVPKAGLLPTADQLETFSSTLDASGLGSQDSNDLHHVLMCFNELASVDGNYFLGRSRTMFEVAKALSDINFPLREKFTLCMSPVMLHSKRSVNCLKRYAMKLERGVSLRVPPHCLEPSPAESFDDISHLCSIVNEVDLLLWLQSRFADYSPVDESESNQALAVKDEATRHINQALIDADMLELDYCYIESDELRRIEFKKKKRNRRTKPFR